jgi:predicted AlkP superfamily phosphohydrolase/phosphomutase
VPRASDSGARTWLGLLLGAGVCSIPAAAGAYVGPGAGFAFFGSFTMLLVAFGAGLFSLLAWPLRIVLRSRRRRRMRARTRVRRMVILGLDGLDPGLVERWMAAGELPNLAALAQRGSYARLGTTYPAISPVAWSSFMTGVGPARHNVFDFITRDPRSYAPALAGSQIGPPRRSLRVGDWLIPLSSPTVRSLRRSRAFWSILGEHGVPCQVLRVPLTFPPERFAGALLSAMCVPDLRGSQGSFTFFTSDPATAEGRGVGGEGGTRVLVSEVDGVIRASLAGPPSPLRADHAPLEIPFALRPDRERRRARLRIAGRSLWLAEREYSPWIRLRFRAAPGVSVHGLARFYLTSLAPHFGLYVTPLNLDPARPALPISYPSYYALYLQKMIGDFATLGLAEDTWALNEGVIDEDAFLQQTWDLHAERERMFENALSTSREGLIACVFDGTDRLQHMFFRYLDPGHPAACTPDAPRAQHAILEMYRRADALVGRTLARLDPRDQLLILSDHGFAPFRRGVNLNSWLRERGLLVLREEPGAGGEWFQGVDWKSTRAYALGLGGIYLNLRGREAQGAVGPGEAADALRDELIAALSGLRDEARGAVAIRRVYAAARAYGPGPYAAAGPDLVVGYAAGYRASWEGAVGRVTPEVFSDNTRAWSGDHCIDPELVPGVLFSSRPIRAAAPHITDLAPTVLTQFGVEVPAHMTGRALEVEAGAQA